jgi:hypothetical protein
MNIILWGYDEGTRLSVVVLKSSRTRRKSVTSTVPGNSRLCIHSHNAMNTTVLTVQPGRPPDWAISVIGPSDRRLES